MLQSEIALRREIVKLDFAKIAELDNTYKLVDDNLYQKKNKNISILSSDKTMCELHTLRIETAKYLKRNHLADTYGTFDGGQQRIGEHEPQKSGKGQLAFSIQI